jgi:hypothetical protein
MSLIYFRNSVVETVEDEVTEFRRNVDNRLLVVTSESRKEETSSTPLLNILTYSFICMSTEISLFVPLSSFSGAWGSVVVKALRY